MGDLTSVRSEVEQVAAVLHPSTKPTTSPVHLCPSKRVVPEDPSSCTISYFAGHGNVDTTDDPATSRNFVINPLASAVPRHLRVLSVQYLILLVIFASL
ncbi:hypothetical protein BDV35DRAFT_140074 [Aspergillus flavus]|uniref:Uncharacterized protein n=1 Tax=Aspergillus flavus TaxID=5059 RepID=A0A5N6H833_ASPFL|nr:hypothetical protein BDV35DRAFT_140074 [Aspergillus flavus]